MTHQTIQPEVFQFADDGRIPNSRYPLLLYRNAFSAGDAAGALWLENHFRTNNWTNAWRNGVFSYHHYHSTTHEVLGVYSGSASLRVGGPTGKTVSVQAGDILVIPAGVGHKNENSSTDFGVVGAYPDGRSYDTLRGEPGERPRADQNIAAVPLPIRCLVQPVGYELSGLTRRMARITKTAQHSENQRKCIWNIDN